MRKLLVVLVSVLVLTGCQAEPMPAKDAIARYDAVISDVQQALAGLNLKFEEQRHHTAKVEDGKCLLLMRSPRVERDGWLNIFDSAEWAQTLEKVNEALAKWGFGKLGQPKMVGGVQEAQTQDEHRAQLAVANDGGVWISRILVDAPECTNEALGFN